MRDRQVFLESAYLYMQGSKLILAAVPLQRQIQVYNQELRFLIGSGLTPAKKAHIRDLKDEIFSCEIEIQALRMRANRLLKEAQNMRLIYAEVS